MPSQGSPARYSAVAQAIHWLIAALIVTQFVLAIWADDLPLGAHKLALLARHKSFGMTMLMLAVLRLLWRLKHPPPELPSGMTPVERMLARATHAAFYVLLFAMPLTGWLMSSAKSYSVSWFGLFTWPNLIGKNAAAFDFLRNDARHFGRCAVRAGDIAHSRRPQASLLEQGRCVAAHAALHEFRNDQNGETPMTKHVAASTALLASAFLSAAAAARARATPPIRRRAA